MDYEQKYKDALERAKKLQADAKGLILNKWLYGVFPELKERTDVDKVMKEKLHEILRLCYEGRKCSICASDYSKLLAWIEKQGEQKPADRVEPKQESKFKTGTYIVYLNDTYMLEDDGKHYILTAVKKNASTPVIHIPYGYEDCTMREWNISDAKDGDVLYHKSPLTGIEYIVVSRGVNGFGNVDSYFRYNSEDGFCIGVPSVFSAKLNNITPAAKEQCDLLFQKMQEAGYEWDAEKKELKKIEQKPEIKDDVLSRFAFYQYDDDTLYLSSLFVRDSDRGRGYGSKVLKAAEEVAKTFGVSKIRLKVERNTWMEEWYEKNGYEYLSSEGKYNWLENRVTDTKPGKSLFGGEEDENNFNTILNLIRDSDMSAQLANRLAFWLKSLKHKLSFHD